MGHGGCEQRHESVGADDDSGWISAFAPGAGQDSAVLLGWLGLHRKSNGKTEARNLRAKTKECAPLSSLY